MLNFKDDNQNLSNKIENLVFISIIILFTNSFINYIFKSKYGSKVVGYGSMVFGFLLSIVYSLIYFFNITSYDVKEFDFITAGITILFGLIISLYTSDKLKEEKKLRRIKFKFDEDDEKYLLDNK